MYQWAGGGENKDIFLYLMKWNFRGQILLKEF